MILASRSPRRRELLRSCGIDFTCCEAVVEELHPGCGIPVRELPARNARLKAAAVANRFPCELVLGADTMVILGDKAYGKPVSPAESAVFLAELSGKTHEVITGMALINLQQGVCDVWSETAKVTFRELSPEDIQRYIAQVNTLDKAGAYAIQEHADLIIDRCDGEVANVTGLPLVLLKNKLDFYCG